ncbi:hypothetical protein [Frigoriglobus tundricola]|uniref:Uncharacterized protein n=1 Tax=Frigoriglobus tundricola TaxID=2774151 RepID=A0A6M5YMR5_9BACT|nr:hypothetical protein [Frigoriglobus tundricola]QJW95357.1 hypothetical protein FTUN_2905 [Frigoriglobus tundricola]
MIARALEMTILPLTRVFARSAPARPRGADRRRSARWVLLYGVLAFGLLTLALETAAETVRPEWRDPEYGYRLRAVRRWQRERPDRPLVLVLGSSRTQFGVSPADMNLPDEPGAPLVYNFGYTSAFPLGMWFQLSRLFDDGIQPAVVLVEFASIHTRIDGPAEVQFELMGLRLSAGDVRRFAPYTSDPTVFGRQLDAARRNPWASRRPALMGDLLPDWRTADVRANNRVWESMDPYGRIFFRLEGTVDPTRRLREEGRKHASGLDAGEPGAVSDRALRDLAAACHARGIKLALFRAPESPEYRTMYTPAGRTSFDEYARTLARDFGAPVFPAPDMDEADFADGFHLLPAGAAKYSRWLAERHLKPWLAEALR